MQPAYRLTVNGEDISPVIAPYLVDLTVTDKPGMEADELTLTLAPAAALKLPPVGGVVTVAIGFDGSLTAKGTYKIDEVGERGPPDLITVSAKSAEFDGKIKETRDKSYSETTLGAIITDIASRNGLTPAIDPGLGATGVPHIDQTNESDIAFATRIAKDYDALCQIKDKRLVFMPMAATTTTGGSPIPVVTISRTATASHDYRRASRDASFTAVKATWQQYSWGSKEEVVAGTVKSDSATKTLKKSYPTEAQARAAAEAELSRLGRGSDEITLGLAVGNPAIISNARMILQGWRPEITGVDWLVQEVTHSLDGGSGYKTTVKACAAGDKS